MGRHTRDRFYRDKSTSYISISAGCLIRKRAGGGGGNRVIKNPRGQSLVKNSSAPNAYRESKGYYIGSSVEWNLERY